MKKNRKGIIALLLATVICLGLAACGTDDGGVFVDNGENPAPSPYVTVKTGEITTDSWGYTSSGPILVEAPSQTEILINGHTLLLDASRGVVSGTTSTRISFSSEKTTLTATAQASAPANFVSFVNISMGSAKTASQKEVSVTAVSVTVDVSPVTAGTILNIYNYDAGTGKWISQQTAVVSSSGKITFPVTQLSLWGIFG